MSSGVMFHRASAQEKQAMRAAKLVSKVGVRDEDDWRERVRFAAAVLADIESVDAVSASR
jgi:hypothetical protein